MVWGRVWVTFFPKKQLIRRSDSPSGASGRRAAPAARPRCPLQARPSPPAPAFALVPAVPAFRYLTPTAAWRRRNVEAHRRRAVLQKKITRGAGKKEAEGYLRKKNLKKGQKKER